MSWDIDVREKVYQRLANEIFFRILHGEYVMGAKLPSYINIAKEAGSSPETVRKAVRVLQEHGVIEKTRLGCFVSSDEKVISAYCQEYLAVVEKEYLNAKEKVDLKEATQWNCPPTLILNLALLIVPPVALVLVFRQWLARHIRWTVALTALCKVLLNN